MTHISSLPSKTPMPEFSKFQPQAVQSQIDDVLAHCRKVVESVLKAENFTWNGFVQPIEEAEEWMSQIFSPASHLNMVQNSPELRESYEYAIEKLSDYGTEMGQNKALYDGYMQVLRNDTNLTEAQKKALDNQIISFKRSGVALQGAQKQRFKEISAKLSMLQNKFENNVLDATMAWNFHTENSDDLLGLSEDTIAAAEHKAKQEERTGYLLGIDAPTYMAVVQQSQHRWLREKFYKAYATRASNQSEYPQYDNAEIMTEILQLRDEKSQLLGFAHYADYSLDVKMAPSVAKVVEFLENLVDKSKAQARTERAELQAFANRNGLDGDLMPWDVAYYSEKLKKEKFDFTEEELRPYFPISQVLKGLYEILGSIYGLKAKIIDTFDRYHDDVQLIAFYDEKGEPRGKTICDFYARQHKRGGAWMDDCRTRYVNLSGELQTPVAYVCCNFMPPTNGKEALLTHNDVVTLFHEFGHALHHILTKVDDMPVSGISGVEWDAVELPSQFMENFCWHADGIAKISKHYQTGESLPQALFERLVASRAFQSGMAMLRQIEFSLFDIELHCAGANAKPRDVIERVRQKVAIAKVPDYHRFENSFGHIFAGGYAAGYYSYKWAEVLSSDAFAMFEEKGDIFSPECGRKFLNCILEKGGTLPAGELFKNYRGREPDIAALLRHSGIKA